MARNKKNFDKLIELLENLDPRRFDMRDLRKETACGTVCCIAGWANALAGIPCGNADDAQEWLGLSEYARDSIFVPYEYHWTTPQACDLPAAIAELKRLRDGGRPDPNWLVKARAAE